MNERLKRSLAQGSVPTTPHLLLKRHLEASLEEETTFWAAHTWRRENIPLW